VVHSEEPEVEVEAFFDKMYGNDLRTFGGLSAQPTTPTTTTTTARTGTGNPKFEPMLVPRTSTHVVVSLT
jgi:hypothetical protein